MFYRLTILLVVVGFCYGDFESRTTHGFTDATSAEPDVTTEGPDEPTTTQDQEPTTTEGQEPTTENPCPPCYPYDCKKPFHPECECQEGYAGFFCEQKNGTAPESPEPVGSPQVAGCKPCKHTWSKKVAKVSGHFGMDYFDWSKFVGKENQERPSDQPNFPPFPPFLNCHGHGKLVCKRNE